MIKIAVRGTLPPQFRLKKAEVRESAEFFAERSRARVGYPAWHEVVVHLVDDAASEEIHRAIMGIDGATDVVTQAYDAIPPETPGLLGELFVNTDQALRAAPKRKGWTVAKELLLYIAHGMDHLSGADDHEECDYSAMRRRELGWLCDLSQRRAQASCGVLQMPKKCVAIRSEIKYNLPHVLNQKGE